MKWKLQLNCSFRRIIERMTLKFEKWCTILKTTIGIISTLNELESCRAKSNDIVTREIDERRIMFSLHIIKYFS